jgi:hypothetical protein
MLLHDDRSRPQPSLLVRHPAADPDVAGGVPPCPGAVLAAEVGVLHRIRTVALVAVLVAAVGLGGAVASPAVAAAAQAVESVAYENGGIAVSTPPGAPPTTTRGRQQPAVSPDGAQLAWVATAAGRPHVFVGALDGSGARQVSGGDAYDGAPVWSPDNARLAYEHLDPNAGELTIWIVNADGSGGHAVPGLRGAGPVWSPDGRFLAFNDGAGNVGAVAPDGRGPTVLGSGMTVWDWSADGTRLAVSRRSAPGSGLFRLGDRAAATVLQNGDTESYDRPHFAASGQQLYVDHQRFPSKSDLTSDLERWSLDGLRDDSFPGLSMDFGGDISDGGGPRAIPAVTTPSAVTALTSSAAPSEVALRFTLPTAAETAGVTVRYAAGSTPPATVTDGVGGGDTLGSTLTVNRLAASTTYSFSVFTRDWSGAASAPVTATTTTPADVATTLTLTGPGTITYGQSSTLRGRLVRGDTGDGVPGATVVLLGHHSGQPDITLATLSTDSAGGFSTTRATSQGTRYTVRYPGAAPLVPAGTGTLVLVRQRVTIAFAPGPRVAAHRPASVTVTVAPAFPGGRVRVQQHLYEAGPNVLTRLDTHSRATIRFDTSRRQTSVFQNVAVTPGARSGYLNDPTYANFVVF